MNKVKFSAILYATFAVSAFAQNAPLVDPPELIARREEHLRAMQRAEEPVLSAYVRTLEGLKAQYIRDSKLSAAVAVDNELNSVKRQLAPATRTVNGVVAPMRLTIVTARFGDPKTSRLVDVTKPIQKALASGEPTMRLEGGALYPGKDPAPFVHKSVTITYIVNGERKEKVFEERAFVNFANDLQ